MKRLGTLGFAVGVAAAAVPASAQAPSSTGANVSGGQDQSWQVQYTNGNAPSGSGFFNAYVVQGAPGVWETDTGAYQWISAAPDGSIGPNSNYTYQTTFNLTGYDPNSVSLVFRCAVDNNFVSFSLNGTLTNASCGDGNSSGFKFGSAQTLSSGFVAGVNTLSVNSTGDGSTDGFIMSVDRFSASPVTTTPEPGSLALLGTGLVGLVPTLRRRKR